MKTCTSHTNFYEPHNGVAGRILSCCLFLLCVLLLASTSAFAWENQTFSSPSTGGWTQKTFGAGEDPNSIDKATEAGDLAQEKLGSSEALNKNAAVPLTGSTAPVESLNGQNSGYASLSKASSSAFLQIFMQTSGTGDLQLLMASQDLNYDGVYDYTYSPPKPVSGICADGFVSCDPGSWKNCEFRKWVSQSGRLNTEVVAISQVSGCYCINNSCGVGLVLKNSGIILGHLGGGAATALTIENPQHQLTEVDILKGKLRLF